MFIDLNEELDSDHYVVRKRHKKYKIPGTSAYVQKLNAIHFYVENVKYLFVVPDENLILQLWKTCS